MARIRTQLADGLRAVTISSDGPFRMRDGTGGLHELAAGAYRFGADFNFQLAEGEQPTALTGPLRFLPGTALLRFQRPYRGVLDVASTGKRLSVVNDVGLDAYVRGVVSREMPRDWPLEAVKAQAVAARSYALAQRRAGAFDVYADTRDQVYGGVAAETPVGNAATDGTRRQALFFDGKVATTFFFSTSGGQTASVGDVFSGARQIPYLRSVPDPYDSLSPYHTWGPVAIGAARASKLLGVAGVTDLRPIPATGRAREVVVVGRNGEFAFAAPVIRRALELRSTWFRVGVLSLTASGRTLTGSVSRLKSATLERRVAGGVWEAGPPLELRPDGTFELAVEPGGYRLAAGDARGAPVSVAP